MDRKIYYLMWANLVDMAYGSLLSNIAIKKGKKMAMEEIRKTLLRKGWGHWLAMSKMLKKLK